MAMRNPVHPGDFIRTEIIEAHALSVTAAAKVLGVSRPALSNLLNQNADLSGEMALRIEKAFGVSMDTLMRMQAAYDIAQARKDANKIRVRRYHSDGRVRESRGGGRAGEAKVPSSPRPSRADRGPTAIDSYPKCS